MENLDKRSFKPLLKRAGLPKIRFHDLRHTCATLLLGRGVHPKLVQELLGHATIAHDPGQLLTLPALDGGPGVWCDGEALGEPGNCQVTVERAGRYIRPFILSSVFRIDTRF
jgi:hypothetical protein